MFPCSSKLCTRTVKRVQLSTSSACRCRQRCTGCFLTTILAGESSPQTLMMRSYQPMRSDPLRRRFKGGAYGSSPGGFRRSFRVLSCARRRSKVSGVFHASSRTRAAATSRAATSSQFGNVLMIAPSLRTTQYRRSRSQTSPNSPPICVVWLIAFSRFVRRALAPEAAFFAVGPQVGAVLTSQPTVVFASPHHAPATISG